MSNYQDDTQETAVASDSVWAGLTNIVEESARILSAAVFGMMVLHSDGATASDQVIDSPGGMLVEQAQASDSVLDTQYGSILMTDSAKASDALFGALMVLHTDTALASDELSDAVQSLIVEQAGITDTVLASRRVATLTIESARASDLATQAASVLVEDAAAALDWSGGTLRGSVLLVDTATLSDAPIDAQRSTAPALIERATASDAVLDRLLARDVIEDSATIENPQPLGSGDYGQAWTANVDTWAMSRYAPFAFDGLTVIDGVAYGTAAGGVYALDSAAELIPAVITTGKLDVGKGALVHPSSAIMEYQLSGTAALDVITTQSGQAETYTYALPAEPAAELTNGRFVLGRGLRGRHFALTLRLTATQGCINDFSVQATPTKRRV